jgi:hypothetical protein
VPTDPVLRRPETGKLTASIRVPDAIGPVVIEADLRTRLLTTSAEVATARGYCERHRRTTTQRGYGASHQRERAVALPGATCAACGCSRQLQRDHIVPRSIGGSDDASNKRWLCDCPEHRCHSRLGSKSNRRGRGLENCGGSARPMTRAPLLVRGSVFRISSLASRATETPG